MKRLIKTGLGKLKGWFGGKHKPPVIPKMPTNEESRRMANLNEIIMRRIREDPRIKDLKTPPKKK